ncbi:MAG: hypothetical protein J6Y01_04860, partial [Spirochaetales bacterium]|nr:hypothetical protein [Spirochaetales bacterium]
MKTIIRFMTFMMFCLVLTCCVAVGGQSGKDGNSQNGTTVNGNDSGSGGSGNGSENNGLNQKDVEKAITRSAALDALYDNTTLGEVNLTFTQDNWNTLVSNSNSKNKTLYSTCDYQYIKGDNTYDITGIGIK